jgi:hypothetical protein
MPADDPSTKKDQPSSQNKYANYIRNDLVKLSNTLQQQRDEAKKEGLDELLHTIDRLQTLIDKKLGKEQKEKNDGS